MQKEDSRRRPALVADKNASVRDIIFSKPGWQRTGPAQRSFCKRQCHNRLLRVKLRSSYGLALIYVIGEFVQRICMVRKAPLNKIDQMTASSVRKCRC